MKVLKGITGLVIASTIFFASCEKNSTCINGEGSTITRVLNVSSFNEIDLAEAGNVIISQGTYQEVKVVTQSNIADRIKTNVSNNRWVIDLEDGCYNNYDLTVYVTVPDIKNVILSGSGNMTINNFENQSSLEITISGSGDVALNSFSGAQNFEAIISGSGDIIGNGSFEDLVNSDITIIGSGNYVGFPISSLTSDILISGSGNIETTVTQSMDVTISGSGNVYYKGYPGISTKITGSGNVISSN